MSIKKTNQGSAGWPRPALALAILLTAATGSLAWVTLVSRWPMVLLNIAIGATVVAWFYAIVSAAIRSLLSGVHDDIADTQRVIIKSGGRIAKATQRAVNEVNVANHEALVDHYRSLVDERPDLRVVR